MTLPRRLKKKFTVPIYGADVWLVISDDVVKARQAMDSVFGELEGDIHDWDAVCCHGYGHVFGLFFNRKTLSTSIMAHEVFHLTHRILEWASCNFDCNHHESGALLHGYLMDLVWREMWNR